MAAIGGMHARLWDVATGTERSPFKNAGFVVGFFPDGKTLVTAPGGKILLWDVETRLQRLTIPLPALGLRAAALSPDGTRVATSSHSLGDSIRLWDTVTGEQRAAFAGHPGIKRALAFSKDGKMLASGSDDRTAIVWDVETGRQLGQDVHLDPLASTAFSPDGKTLATSTLGGAIKLWEMAPPEESNTIPVGPGIASLTYSPDGRTLTVGSDGSTRLIDVPTGKGQAALPVQGVLAATADAALLAGAGPDGTKRIWDVRAGREVTTLPVGAITGATFSPDGKALATFQARRDHITVTLWDIATRQSRTLTVHPPDDTREFIHCAAFSSDGKLLAAGFRHNWITVWDVATGKVKLQFPQRPGMMKVLSLAFSPDNKALAVGTDVGTVTLWEVEPIRLAASFKGHTLPVHSLAFSPDGKTLATASADQTLRLWDVTTGQERITLKGHEAAIVRVAFAPDGQTLATASADGTVKLWRTATDSEALAWQTQSDANDPYTWFWIAAFHRDAGRLADAIRLFEQVREKLTKTGGPDHPRTLNILSHLASAHLRNGKAPEAIRLFEQVRDKRIEALGPDHPDTLSGQLLLAGAYSGARQFDRAAESYSAVLDSERRRQPPDKRSLANALALLGSELLKAGQAAEAELMLRECLLIRQKTEPNQWTTFNAQAMLGGALLRQKKYADAEPLLVQGYEAMKQRENQVPPAGKPRLTEAWNGSCSSTTPGTRRARQHFGGRNWSHTTRP